MAWSGPHAGARHALRSAAPSRRTSGGIVADWTTTTVRHGTQSGWRLHTALGERPCDPCYQAKSAYDKRRREAPKNVQMSRIRARAQSRAESALRQRNPGLYKTLYDGFLAEEIRKSEL